MLSSVTLLLLTLHTLIKAVVLVNKYVVDARTNIIDPTTHYIFYNPELHPEYPAATADCAPSITCEWYNVYFNVCCMQSYFSLCSI